MVALLAALSCLSAGHAGADEPGLGWQLERDVDSPTYAFIEPAITDLDVDVMVLSCEPTERKSGLQLRLYPPEPGPFRSAQSSPIELAPDVVIDIDGRRYAARLLFADDFVVVANAADGAVPVGADREALHDEAAHDGDLSLLQRDTGVRDHRRPSGRHRRRSHCRAASMRYAGRHPGFRPGQSWLSGETVPARRQPVTPCHSATAFPRESSMAVRR